LPTVSNSSLITESSTRSLIKRLWTHYLRAHLGKISLSVLCMFVVAAAAGVQARLIEPALDQVLVSGDEKLLWILPIAFFGGLGQTVLMHKVGLRVIATLQSQMFSRIVTADIAFIHDDATGKFISRFTNDVNFLREAVIKVVTGFGRDLMLVIVLVGVMFYTDAWLAFMTFVVFPVSIAPIAMIGRRLRRVSSDTQSELGVMTAALDDIFKGMRQVKAYGAEPLEQNRADQLFERIYKLIYKAARVRSLSYPIMESLSGFAVAAVLCYGGYQVLNGETTVGRLMAFLTALVMAYQPLRSLSNLNASLQEGLASAERIFELIDYQRGIVDAPNAKPLRVTDGHVRLENVHFSYNDALPALCGISIDAPKGHKIALVGPSGAGKSTILNLLLRFYDVNEGSIWIDGQEIKDVTMESLRASIALVSQETGLFNTTIRENIAYGRPDASEADIIAAATDAAAHDFISALPDGYDTLIGEQGQKLSGGQRQRVSIARAMLKDAPILLLDEATSALDTESERYIQKALARLTEGRTTFIIAHRLSTIANADIICVLDHGAVVERGNHQTLLKQQGLYRRLCDLQFGDNAGNGSNSPTFSASAAPLSSPAS
jgi:subfamily B ATP-binding cassette protein MsbA